MGGSWGQAEEDALSWIHSVASDPDEAGMTVGPMPDKVYVLHPLFERIDGEPMSSESDSTDAPERIVRWREYAARRSIPMFVPPGHPSLRHALPGVWHDDTVSPPSEGEIADSTTRQALFDILLRHTQEANATGIAYFYWFWVGDPNSKRQLPNVLHGPLTSWPELFELPEYVMPPQNIWPDDHSWVLCTHTDSWATEVSGPVALIEEIIASPDLEAIRLPDLD